MCLSLMVGLGVCIGGSWWELSMCVILTGAAFVLIHVWLGLHMCLSLSVGLGVFHQQVGLVGALRISLFEVLGGLLSFISVLLSKLSVH